jgi:low affinity Fe/Cu permease
MGSFVAAIKRPLHAGIARSTPGHHRPGGAWRGRLPDMKRRNPLQRATDRFAADPASVKNAVYVMIVITVGIVLVGGVIVWVFDRRDFPDLGGALWYTLQTVTTVGYGDQVPTTEVGRLVGASVMIVGVALIAILTASITSVFVEAAQRRQRAGREAQERDSVEALHQRLDEVITRLTAIEATLSARDADPDATVPQDRP